MIRRLLLALIFCGALAGSTPAYWKSVQQISVGGAPPAYTGPGDVVSGAAAFWGLRGYNAAFSGAVANICDQATGLVCSDATWANGVLTIPSIGGLTCDNVTNLCQVKTLYDQSGALACAGSTACDLSQATAALRPTLVVAGAANGCPTTSFPCMAFVRASTQCLLKATSYTRVQPISVIFTGTRTGNTTLAQQVLAANSAALAIGWTTSADTIRISAGTGVNQASVVDNSWHAVQGIWSSSVGAISADGTTTTTNNGANAFSSSSLVLGAQNTTCTTSALDGKLVEVGIWPADITASIAAFNSNVHSYWGF